MKIAIKILLVLILFLLSSENLSSDYVFMSESVRFEIDKIIFYNEIENEPFTEELLRKVIEYEKISYPEIVILQAQIETGLYTSNIFNNGHNCFGMKFPKYRQTVASGIYHRHAQYDSWIDSVIDYKLWQEWYISIGYKIVSQQDDAMYLVFLQCIKYAEDPNYIPKLLYLLAYKDLT